MAYVRKMKAKKKVNGSTKTKVTVVVGEDNSKSVKSVQVYIPAIPNQPTPEPENIVLYFERMEGEDRIFSYDNLNFSSDPVDFTYEMTATMKDGSGGTIGSPYSQAVQIEAEVLV